jgi:FkbM family methyltransferase
MELISYAHNYEDIRLWLAFRDVREGRYLDIGAHDSVQNSISHLFYDRGWRGFHVEPVPQHAAAIRSARPDEGVIEAAVSCSQGPLKLYESLETGHSTGSEQVARLRKQAGSSFREILVPTITLASLFDYMGHDPIHWLKIGVEGMEADVLASWGDHPARPAALVVNATEPVTQEPPHGEWYAMVVGRDYREVLFDGHRRYFIHKAHARRSEALALGPGVSDEFQIYRSHFSTAGVTAEADKAVAAAMEQRRTSDVAAHKKAAGAAKALAEAASRKLDEALNRATQLERRLAEDRAFHAAALSQASAAAADAANDLNLALLRSTMLEDKLKEQAQFQAAALRSAEERLAASELALLEANQQVAALEQERAALSRMAGRFEGELAMKKDWHAAQIAAAAAQAEQLRGRLASAEKGLADSRDLSARLHTELSYQFAAVASAADAIADEREKSRRLGAQAGELAASLSAAREERDILVAQVQALSAERDSFAVQVENAGSAAQAGRMLQQEAERLRGELALRQKSIHEAQQIFAVLLATLSATAEFEGLNATRKIRLAAERWQREASLPEHSGGMKGASKCLDEGWSASHPVPTTAGAIMPSFDGPITSAAQLLVHQDRTFIHSAYWSVLGRGPDPEGEAYYLARLRAGKHKLKILRQLRQSPEGRGFTPAVAGLDRAIKHHRLANLPVVGAILAFFVDGEREMRSSVELRRLEQTFVAEMLASRQALALPTELFAMIDHIRRSTERSLAVSQRLQEGLHDVTCKLELLRKDPVGSKMASDSGTRTTDEPSRGGDGGDRQCQDAALIMGLKDRACDTSIEDVLRRMKAKAL